MNKLEEKSYKSMYEDYKYMYNEYEKLKNENLIIDNFLRDLKLIINSYEPLLKNSDVR